jgi:heptosyltransferase II
VAATKKILLIQTAFLGDLLLSVPLLKHLKTLFPDSEISLVCRKGFGSLFQDLQLVEKTYEIQKKNKASYQEALEQLQSIDFDLLLSPHESFTTAIFTRPIRAKMKIGFRKWWNFFFFDKRIKKNLSLPDAIRQMSLLTEQDPLLNENIQQFQKQEVEWRSQGEKMLSPVPKWASPVVGVADRWTELQEKFQLPSRAICLFPGSVWKTKQWTEEGFLELGQKLYEQGHSLLIMGGPGEEELSDRIAAVIPGAISLAGRTSQLETLQILAKADLVVTNDSAGQHLAALVAAPTVSVFGPTVLEFGYRPWNSSAVIVERKGLSCRPCGKHGHNKCPIGTHECMKKITSTEVLQACQEFLFLVSSRGPRSTSKKI